MKSFFSRLIAAALSLALVAPVGALAQGIDPAARGLAVQAKSQAGTLESGVPSAAYIAMNPMNGTPSKANTIGEGQDWSGNNAEITILASIGGSAWTNTGYLTVGGGTGQVAMVQQRKLNFDLASQSIILAFTVNAAAPASTPSNPTLMGNSDGYSLQGVALKPQADGTIKPVLYTSAGAQVGIQQGTSVVLDGTPHNYMIAIDGPKKDVFIWVDGLLQRPQYNAFSGGTPGITSSWIFGGSGTTSPTSQASVFPSKLANFHLLRFTGGLPLSLGDIARRLNANGKGMLTVMEVRPPSKYMAVAIVGQSNEVGAASESTASGLRAWPAADPMQNPYGSGGYRSMWPNLITLAGTRGVAMEVWNSAVGTTSIINNWTGVLRAWSANLLVTRGSYVLSGGNVYKNTTGTVTATTPVTSTVQPTGTATTQTGSDAITWTYMGAARAQDVPGYIYPQTDAYFDPNGFIANAYAGVNRSGFDEKWMFFSIGQGDGTFNTTRAEFATGIQNMTDYFLSRGVKAALGFTCYSATTGAEAKYQAALLPGWSDALAHYAGNPNVVAGANLRTALGVLTVGSGTDVFSLQSDMLHMNNPTYSQGSEAWFTALVAAGVLPAARVAANDNGSGLLRKAS